MEKCQFRNWSIYMRSFSPFSAEIKKLLASQNHYRFPGLGGPCRPGHDLNLLLHQLTFLPEMHFGCFYSYGVVIQAGWIYVSGWSVFFIVRWVTSVSQLLLVWWTGVSYKLLSSGWNEPWTSWKLEVICRKTVLNVIQVNIQTSISNFPLTLTISINFTLLKVKEILEKQISHQGAPEASLVSSPDTDCNLAWNTKKNTGTTTHAGAPWKFVTTLGISFGYFYECDTPNKVEAWRCLLQVNSIQTSVPHRLRQQQSPIS